MDVRLAIWGGALAPLTLLVTIALLFNFRPEVVRGLLFATVFVVIVFDPNRRRRR